VIADWVTAGGTLVLGAVAVWVALWSDKRTGDRLATEHARSDRQLAEERERHDKELAEERAHSEQQVAREQEFSRAQIEEERRLSREREQLAEAYAVQVSQAEQPSGTPETRALFTIVVNRGSYTITRIEAQFHLNTDGNGSLTTAHQTERITSYADLDERLRRSLSGPPERDAYTGKLTPWDIGMRFRTDSMATRYTVGWYPVVRWNDRWGTRWEHKQGEVRQVADSAIWEP
jgi:hypothetical protein